MIQIYVGVMIGAGCVALPMLAAILRAHTEIARLKGIARDATEALQIATNRRKGRRESDINRHT